MALIDIASLPQQRNGERIFSCTGRNRLCATSDSFLLSRLFFAAQCANWRFNHCVDVLLQRGCVLQSICDVSIRDLKRKHILTLSSFHILCNHSCGVSRFCNRLDYMGILVLMWGAGIPSIYYGFICHPRLQSLYWTLVGTAFIYLLVSLINAGLR